MQSERGHVRKEETIRETKTELPVGVGPHREIFGEMPSIRISPGLTARASLRIVAAEEREWI